MHVPWARVWKLWQVLGAQFFVTIVLMKFVLKNPCQQQCIFSVAPCQRSYACPVAQRLHTAGNKVLGAQFFGTTALMEFVLKTRANSSASQYTSLPPNRALPKPFPTIYFPSTLSSLPYRSFPMELSSCYFPRFRSRPFTLSSLPYRSLTELSHSHGFPSVHPIVASIWLLPAIAELSPCYFTRFPRHLTLSSLPYRSFPTELSPSYFPRFPSVHPVVASISSFLLPKPFLTISSPSTLSSLPSGSFPTELSPFYFPRFPVRPPPRRFRTAPSQQELCPSYFPRLPFRPPCPRFPRVLPDGTLPKLFPTVSPPSTLSSLPSRSFPTDFSPSFFPRFPFRPPCRHFHLVPSQLC